MPGLIIIGFYLVVLLTMGYGWVMNITSLLNLEVFTVSFATIVACIGVIVPPVGAFMGLFYW